MNEREALRNRMRVKRKALSRAQQEEAAQAVYERLCALEAYANAQCVMAYMAARGELSLAPVIEDLLGRGCMLALPRCEAPGVMTARRVTDIAQLVQGAYGLWEPDVSCEVLCPEQMDLILVPGTAFDRSGGRIGQGGGYYDRFLPGMRALRVGICHGFALLDSLPMYAHDQRMDMIITPDETVTKHRVGRMHG